MKTETEIFIYCRNFSARLDYIAGFLSDSLGLRFRIADKIVNDDKPLIHYGKVPDSKIFSIPDSGFLHEKGIRPFIPEIHRENGVFLFPVKGNFNLQFDLFAAIFYLISRYEEYLPFIPDRHGRFEIAQSFSYRNDFHQEPVIDKWLILLRKALTDKYPRLIFPDKKYAFIPTIDIDSPWAFRYRRKGRNLPGLAKSIMLGNLKEARYRLQSLAGAVSDPFDVYSFIRETDKKYKTKSLIFFLLADNGFLDPNHSLESEEFKRLMDDLSADYELGIHPSYASNSQEKKLDQELELYRSFVGKSPEKSRQHYLILKFPETYRKLVQKGLKDDYSMGYASSPSFRAGTTLPFRFYDLEREQKTDLTIHPFAVMDITMQKYMKVNPEKAIQVVSQIIQKIREVNGVFTSLWHNESLSEFGPWKGWRKVYIQMISQATEGIC
ncbi:MAG TPA: polysaccharide deacetylase family protein [Bacteroidales bacterium]|jgi:hypothetical protein|nr:polysaccharide deacetylase family protein [Bacteroidales bacterium]